MSRNLAKAGAGVTIVLIMGYLLSFVKEACIANYFGISGVVDAYTIAIQMPVLIFSFVSVAIKAVIIPLYSDIYYNQGKDASRLFASNFISANFIGALCIIVAGCILAGPLTKFFAPGFDSATHEMAVDLMRVTIPIIVFTVVTDILVGISNVHKQYVLTSMGVYLLNLSIIGFVILLHDKWGIKAACIGQLFGGLLQMSFIYMIVRRHFQYRFYLQFKDPHLIKSLKMSLPVIWGISVAEVNAMVNRMVASMLFVGSIAAISYARRLDSVFSSFFISAVSIIMYPLYAESTAKNDYEQLSSRVNTTLSVYCAVLVPLMFFLLCFRKEIVEVAFARGAFDDSAVDLTQGLLGCYCIGLVFMAFRGAITNVFYSMKDTKTTAVNSTMGAILNIILNLTLPYVLGVYGLAIATSVTAMFISVRLLVKLQQKNNNLNLKYFFENIKRIVPAALIMFVIILIVHYFIKEYNCWIVFIGGAIVTVSVYLPLMYLLRVPVLDLAWNVIKNK